MHRVVDQGAVDFFIQERACNKGDVALVREEGEHLWAEPYDRLVIDLAQHGLVTNDDCIEAVLHAGVVAVVVGPPKVVDDAACDDRQKIVT